MYGTVNYANAVFTKLSNSTSENTSAKDVVTESINKWLLTLQNIKIFLANKYNLQNYDSSAFNVHIREEAFLSEKINNRSMLLVSNNNKFRQYAAWVLANYFPFIKDIKITDKITKAVSAIEFDYVIYHEYEKEHMVNGISNTLCIIESTDVSVLEKNRAVSYFTVPQIKNTNVINNQPPQRTWQSAPV